MIERAQRASVVDAARQSRVALVVGPRQAGKTTLIRDLARRELPMSYVTLDDAGSRRLAQADPAGFVAGLTRPAAIDEVQRVPEVLLEIKRVVDEDPSFGQFVLTGSARVLSLPRVADALVGRVRSVTLWPLSQAEVEGTSRNLVDDLFAASPPTIEGAPVGQEAWLERALAGGFPEVGRLAAGSGREEWFDSYIETLVQRDVRDLADIRALDEVPVLLTLVAARTTGPLNLSAIANELRISEASVRRYLAVLEAAFVVLRVPAWRRNIGRRARAAPKAQLADSGVMAHLLRLDAKRSKLEEAVAGGLLEGFARMELVKLASWSESQPRVHHLRTKGGVEVDVVFERRGGEVAGVEIKASSTPAKADFRGLKQLREARSERFVAGILLYAGAQTLPFGDRLWAVPISALWRG